MRELMFRAWDTVKNKWIDGGYGFHILGEAMLIGGLFQDYRLEDLNNIVIEQYTGLKDKNGKEIYEGDIIGWEDSDESGIIKLQEIVEFQQGAYQTMSCQWGISEFEVIGDIHENPEMLKETSNEPSTD